MADYPLERIDVSRFGPFREIEVEFSPRLNVFVGDNSTGKSQLLKLLYSSSKALKDANDMTKKELKLALASKLQGVYRPKTLGRLTQRTQGRTKAQIKLKFGQIGDPLSFNFSSLAQTEVNIDSLPGTALADQPIYLPTHELLSFSKGFLALYEQYESDFDETWADTLRLLQMPPLRGNRATDAVEVMTPFSDLLLGGKVVEEDGRFYLDQPGIGNLEASLLAEGQRKLAMIVRLIASGLLLQSGYLFWDEPEANLNPASQKAIATALVMLSQSGTQVFVATHSAFLLRELQMSTGNEDAKYFSLYRDETARESLGYSDVKIQSAFDIDLLDNVALLQAESEQAARYLSW